MNKTETDKKLVQIANTFAVKISETPKQKIFLAIIPAQPCFFCIITSIKVIN